HNKEKGMTFISNKKDKFISYQELYQNSLAISYQLQKRGIESGDELIFQFNDKNIKEFLFVFWACLLDGIIPIPVMAGSTLEHNVKLTKICSTLNKPYIITDLAAEKNVKGFLEYLKSIES